MDIVVSGISKSFGTKIVLHKYNAVFPAHSTTCIMGPSGCGKTTLLRILMGLLPPDTGSVIGVPQLKSAVFQEDRLCESFSAVANVRLVCDKSITDRQIVQQLDKFGLQGSLSQPVSELSGGMRRRVAIVRALLADSEVLFLDEPFKGLDAETRRVTMRHVQESVRGKTVIMVTHSREEAVAIADRVIEMQGIGPSL